MRGVAGRRVYGPLQDKRKTRNPFRVATLQDGLEVERTGRYLVEVLFIAAVAMLVAGLFFAN